MSEEGFTPESSGDASWETGGRCDVVVVGGRVAGASLATHLARAGVRVGVFERAEFPSDTISNHVFFNLAALERLGVLERLLATGAPLLPELSFHVDDVDLSARHPDMAALCVRRRALDSILLDNARAAGARIGRRCHLRSLLSDGRRIRGVRMKGPDGVFDVEAELVVGADGRSSTVARLVGSRRYNITRSERAAGWTYYEGTSAEPVLHFHKRGPDIFYGCPADAGLYMVICVPDRTDFAALRESGGVARMLARCTPLAELVAGATPVREPVLIEGWDCYFRESAGPGWVLVGDAGHFKDPVTGQGISDALRQSERLAEAVVGGLADRSLDRRLQEWWRWRDRDSTEMYWFSDDMGRGGSVTPVLREILKKISEDPDDIVACHELLWHTRRPSRVLTPARLLGASARLLLHGSVPRRQVLGEAAATTRREVRRKLLNRWPRWEERAGYAPPPPHQTADQAGGLIEPAVSPERWKP